MDKLVKKTELIANVAIIIVAILIGVVLVKKYIFPSPSHSEGAHASIKAGAALSLPDMDWAAKEQTIVLVLQKSCRFCSESAPFYQKLLKEAEKNPKARFVTVFPHDVDEGKKYLQELQLNITEVKQVALQSIDVQGTPTLLLVNNAGVVTDVWVGKIPAEDEQKVIDKVSCQTCN